MRALWLLALAFLISPAHAQIGSPSAANVGNHGPICPGNGALCGPVPAIAYTGAIDVVAAPLAYGALRAASAADRGTHVANVCDNTGGVDVNCADVLSDATTGIPPNFPTIVGVTCTNGGAHPCSIKTLYNKGSTGGDWTQATIATRPTWLGNASGSLPAIACNGSQKLVTGATNGPTQPYTFSVVTEKTGNLSAAGAIIADAIGNPLISFGTTAILEIYAGTVVSVAATSSAWHAAQGVVNGASSSISVDGSSSGTANAGGGDFSGNHAISFCVDSFGNFLTGNVGEAGLWGSAFTGTQITNMNSNQHSYWGF